MCLVVIAWGRGDIRHSCGIHCVFCPSLRWKRCTFSFTFSYVGAYIVGWSNVLPLLSLYIYMKNKPFPLTGKVALLAHLFYLLSHVLLMPYAWRKVSDRLTGRSNNFTPPPLLFFLNYSLLFKKKITPFSYAKKKYI